MTQKDKELLLQDLCARLPYEVKVFHPDYDEPQTLDTIFNFNAVLNGGIHCDVDDITERPKELICCKPYLRPLSSMTKEEAKEIATLHGIKDILSIKVTDEYIEVIVDDGVCSTETRTIWYDEIISSIESFDWLNKNMFDYRGLIPKGLAIEKNKESDNI